MRSWNPRAAGWLAGWRAGCVLVLYWALLFDTICSCVDMMTRLMMAKSRKMKSDILSVPYSLSRDSDCLSLSRQCVSVVSVACLQSPTQGHCQCHSLSQSLEPIFFQNFHCY